MNISFYILPKGLHRLHNPKADGYSAQCIDQIAEKIWRVLGHKIWIMRDDKKLHKVNAKNI